MVTLPPVGSHNINGPTPNNSVVQMLGGVGPAPKFNVVVWACADGAIAVPTPSATSSADMDHTMDRAVLPAHCIERSSPG